METIKVEDWLSMKQATDLVSKTRSTIYDWLNDERIKIRVLDMGGHKYYRREDLLAAEKFYANRRGGHYRKKDE